MYCLRTSALADVGNNPGEVEGITSGIGGNIDYLKNIAWTFAGLVCMIGICYVDYSWIGKYAAAGRYMDRSNGTGYSWERCISTERYTEFRFYSVWYYRYGRCYI